MSRSTPARTVALGLALALGSAVAAAVAGCKAKPADHAPAAQAAAPARTGAPPEPGLPDLGAAPPGALPPAELETRSVAAIQQLGDTLAGDANDCDKIAADLKVFLVEYRALLGQLLAQQQRQGDEVPARFTKRAAAVAAGQKLQSALAMCASNPAVVAAMKEFPEE